jgi:thioester reductase-like protein
MIVMPHATLLTGATGFVGMELLAQLADADERPIYTLIRAADQDAADARLAAVRDAVFGSPDAHAERIFAVPGDLERSRLGLSSRQRAELGASVSEVVHGAASVSFAADLPSCRAVNVEGTRRVLDLARELPGLRRLVHVSTAYVAGARRGVCGPELLDVNGPHRNAYERSKAESESLARAAMAELPVAVARPSIIVGHSQTGWTSSFNVLYGPLRAFALGALTMIPGRRDAPVDVVPVDHVVRGVMALLRTPGAEGRTAHLTAGTRATTVGELCALGAAAFGHPAPRLLPSRLYRSVVHPALVRTGPATRRKAIKRGEVYLPYFDVRCSFDAGTLSAAPGLASAPALESYFETLCAFALEARWGRRPITRAQAARLSSLVPAPRKAA